MRRTRHSLRIPMLNSHDPAKMHIQDTTLNGINRGAANDRISAAVADRHREDDAGNMSIQILATIERRVRHISVIPPTVGWREDANCSVLSWSTERNPMMDHFRCGAQLNSFTRPTPEHYWQWLARITTDGKATNLAPHHKGHGASSDFVIGGSPDHGNISRLK